LQEKFERTYDRTAKYDGLISLLGFTPDTVVLAYKFAKPETFVVLHTKETEKFLETVVNYTQAPLSSFFHEPFMEDPSIDIYRALESALKRFPKGSRIAIELTGGKKTMGGALAVASGILDIDQLYIDYKEYMPKFRKPKPASTYIHLVENPMRLSVDLFGGIEIDRATEFFNVGKYDISQALFQQAGERMANPRVAEICTELSRFYSLWNAFDFSTAATLSSALFDQVLRFSDQLTSRFKVNLSVLKNQISTVQRLAANDKTALLWNFYFAAERHEKNGQNDIAALLYYRTMEDVFDNAIKDIHPGFDRSNPDYTLLEIDNDKLNSSFFAYRKTVFRKDNPVEELPSPLAMFDTLCLLGALEHHLSKTIRAPRVANIATVRNLSIYAHGMRPMTVQSLSEMRNLATEILNAYITQKGIGSIEEERSNFEFIGLISRES
jgi:CRISPR-associated protein (TIGR02710 family)